jgi:hypothetical protein
LFLVIETAPKINVDVLQREYKVKKGEDITIEVKYSSMPKPNDEWFVNDRLMKKSKRVKTLLFTDFKSWMHERILFITTLSQKYISNINNNNNNMLLITV